MFSALLSSARFPRDGGPDPPRRGFLASLSPAAYGMLLFLASLTLFFAPLLAYLIILRATSPVWPPPGAPPLPSLMWLSTGILVAMSVVMHAATSAIRAGRARALVRWLLLALALVIAFVLNQVVSWQSFVGHYQAANAWRLVGLFHVFMVTHALHVIGGIVPLLIVTRNAEQRRYSQKRYAGVQFCAMYWHFLDVVWIVMLVALLAPGGE